MAFTLDTSGFVSVGPHWPTLDACGNLWWSDLTPFAQGYVGPLLIDAATRFAAMDLRSPDDEPITAAFWRLAPRTLAAILKDCGDRQWELSQLSSPLNHGHTQADGANFWKRRQAGREPDYAARFPPLTPYLGDDGRVYLREAA